MGAVKIQITEAEVLEAIADAAHGKAPDDARTMAELLAATGRGERVVRRALQKIQAEGRLRVHQLQRQDITGRPRAIPAYSVLPAKRKRAG